MRKTTAALALIGILLYCGTALAQDQAADSSNQTSPSDIPSDIPTLVPTITPSSVSVVYVPPSTPECWDNTSEVYADMERTDPLKQKTYVFCPNTIYQIGFSDRDGTCCTDGEMPLVARSNTRFMCGSDGKASNNCTFTGGIAQFLNSFLSWEEDVVNVVTEGLTFENAKISSIFIGNRGDVHFIDCVVRNNKNTGPVFLVHTPTDDDDSERRLKQARDHPGGALGLLTNEDYVRGVIGEAQDQYMKPKDDGQARRNNQENNGGGDSQIRDWMIANFTGCLFENNEQDERQVNIQFGVVAQVSPQNEAHFTDCVWRNNSYGGDGAVIGFAIIVAANNIISLQDNCFIENAFVGFGTVLVFGGAEYTQSNNYGTTTPNLYCQFLAFSTENLPESTTQIECVEYESQTCTADVFAP